MKYLVVAAALLLASCSTNYKAPYVEGLEYKSMYQMNLGYVKYAPANFICYRDDHTYECY